MQRAEDILALTINSLITSIKSQLLCDVGLDPRLSFRHDSVAIKGVEAMVQISCLALETTDLGIL